MYKILFLIGTYPSYGGTEKVTTYLSNEFVKHGHEVFIASFEQPNPELAKTELEDEIITISLEKKVDSEYNFKTLKDLLLKNEIDFIINQWCLPFYVTRFLNKVRKGTDTKLISVYHNQPNKNAKTTDLLIQREKFGNKDYFKYIVNVIKYGILNNIIRGSVRYVYDKSDQYVVLSESFRQIFANYAFLNEPKKLSVIGNPLTIEVNPINVDEKENLIIYVGRVDFNQKRVERIIKIWESIYEKLPTWKLEIVGDGPDRKRLEEYVNAKQIENISFEGFKDPTEYYERAKMLLFTSEYEGFGLVLIEGMSYGVIPLVYGSYSAVYDIVDNGVDGIITKPPYYKKDFEDWILKIATDVELKEKLSEQGLIKSGYFSVSETCKKWENLFNKIK